MVEPVVLKPRRPCPICKRLSHVSYHPFCSNRCAQIDLNRWMGGHYAIPVVDDERRAEPDSPDDEG